MDVVLIFAILSAIIFLGYFSELIFKKTKIPDVLILIIIGIIIGPVLEWTSPESFGDASELFSTFALIFILFQGSLNIEFRTLIRSLPQTLKLTILNFIFTVASVTVIAYILDYDILFAMLIGSILGGSSSAIVIPLLSQLNLREKYNSILMMESAISDVLCIIASVTILEIMRTGQVVASGIFKSVFISFSSALSAGLIVGLIWVSLMYAYEDLKHSFILSIAVVVGLYAIVESPFIGASGAIAALAFGIVLGNSRGIHEYLYKVRTRHDDENNKNVLLPSTRNFYSEISFFIKTFFFVYLGILIDFSNPYVFVYGLIFSIAIYLIRPLAVLLSFRKESFEFNERTYIEIITPKGLAAAVLAGIAVQSGLITGNSGEFVNIIFSTIFISIMITSILIFLTDKKIFNGFFPFHKNDENHSIIKETIHKK